MFEYLMLLATALGSPKIDVEVLNQNCYIKEIRTDGLYSEVHMMGNCDVIYELCKRDRCEVDHIKQKELNFGKKNIG